MVSRQGQETVRDEIQGKTGGVLQVSPTVIESVTVDGILEVTVSSSFKVNLGNYESKDCFASVKGKFSESTSPTTAGEFLFDHVYAVLNDELNAAKELAPKNSSIHHIFTN